MLEDEFVDECSKPAFIFTELNVLCILDNLALKSAFNINIITWPPFFFFFLSLHSSVLFTAKVKQSTITIWVRGLTGKELPYFLDHKVGGKIYASYGVDQIESKKID